MKRLYIIRGLPGSGKSTLAASIVDGQGDYFEADAYFTTRAKDGRGVYEFQPDRLPLAHGWCQNQVEKAVSRHQEPLAVSNTFSRKWEMKPYEDMALAHGYHVVIIDLFDGGMTDEQLAAKNVHNVPLETIQKMRKRWEK
jgi:predicted kinase